LYRFPQNDGFTLSPSVTRFFYPDFVIDREVVTGYNEKGFMKALTIIKGGHKKGGNK
jgi:hypothetical protein